MEANYTQPLTFLPSGGRYLSVFANYTRIKLEGSNETDFSAIGVQTGYAVNARDAVDLLQAKDPTAAAWWRQHCAHLLDGKRWFLFPTAGCVERA